MKTGAERIADERNRQIEKEGWSSKHDDQYGRGVLTNAAICYTTMAGSSDEERDRVNEQAKSGVVPPGWPWDVSFWKPSAGNSNNHKIRELEKAGALIAAEIDRLQREND